MCVQSMFIFCCRQPKFKMVASAPNTRRVVLSYNFWGRVSWIISFWRDCAWNSRRLLKNLRNVGMGRKKKREKKKKIYIYELLSSINCKENRKKEIMREGQKNDIKCRKEKGRGYRDAFFKKHVNRHSSSPSSVLCKTKLDL